MLDGYVKFWRKTLDSVVYQDDKLFRLWLTCLALANHKEQMVYMNGNSASITVMPGQFITGRESLHKIFYPKKKKVNVSARQLWRTLVKLETLGNVTIKTTNLYTIVTINNWGIYQKTENESVQRCDQSVSKSCPSHVQVMSTNKKEKNEKNIITPPIVPPSCTDDDGEKKAIKPFASYGSATRAEIDRVIKHLNSVTGKKFNVDSHIRSRLQSGFTADDLIRVIDNKLHDPHFVKNKHLLSPATLFRDDARVDAYLNETPADYDESEMPLQSHMPETRDDTGKCDLYDIDRYRHDLRSRDPVSHEWWAKTVLPELEEVINDHTYKLFIEPLCIVNKIDETLTLYSPDADFLQERYGEFIGNTVEMDVVMSNYVPEEYRVKDKQTA